MYQPETHIFVIFRHTFYALKNFESPKCAKFAIKRNGRFKSMTFSVFSSQLEMMISFAADYDHSVSKLYLLLCLHKEMYSNNIVFFHAALYNAIWLVYTFSFVIVQNVVYKT